MKPSESRPSQVRKYSAKQIITFVILGMQVLPLLMLFQNCSPGFKLSDQAVLSSLSVSSLSVNAEVPSLINTPAFTLDFDVTAEPAGNLKSVSCVVDESEPVDCTSGQLSFSGLEDGDHILEIIPKDNAGSSQPTFKYMFRVDQTPPTARIVDAPAAVVGATSVRITYDSTDVLSGVVKTQCALDADPFADCAGPFLKDNLAAGNHSFRIRAVDLAGNISEEKSVSWSIDISAPSVMITSQAALIQSSPRQAISFVGTDDGQPITNFECSVDTSAFVSCTSPYVTAELPEGEHKINVRGKDRVGNVSAVATQTVILDLTSPTAPVITTTVVSPTTESNNAPFSFTSTDAYTGVLSYLCSFNDNAFIICSAPKVYGGLELGKQQRFRVYAIDKAGNASPISEFKWNVLPIFAGKRYTSECQTDKANPAITFRIYNDYGATQLTHGVVYYYDRTGSTKCQKPGWVWIESPTYKVLDLVLGTGGGVAVNFQTSQISVYPQSDDIGNSFSLSRACGVDAWSPYYGRSFDNSQYQQTGGSSGVCGYYKSLMALNGVSGNVLKVGDYSGVPDNLVPTTRPTKLRNDLPMYESVICTLPNAAHSRLIERGTGAPLVCEPLQCLVNHEIKNGACVPLAPLTSLSPETAKVYRYVDGRTHYNSLTLPDSAIPASAQITGSPFLLFRSGVNANYRLKECIAPDGQRWYAVNCPAEAKIGRQLNAYSHYADTFNGTKLKQLYWCRPSGTSGFLTTNTGECATSDVAPIPQGFAL